MKTTAAILMSITIASSSVHATPQRSTTPAAYVARVDGVGGVDGVLYGTFRKRERAAEFCRRVPAKYRCEVVGVEKPVEWLRKGAR